MRWPPPTPFLIFPQCPLPPPSPRESAQREMERRIVAQMLTCMDDMSAPPPPPQQQQQGQGQGQGQQGGGAAAGGGKGGVAMEGAEGAEAEAMMMAVDETQPGGKDFTPHPHVIVIGATNRPDSLDPALR